jgi:hypothetical protein
MKKLAVLASVALIGVGSFASTQAEARSRNTARAVVAGVVGGLAAGALIGAAANAYAAPSYGYGPGYAPSYSYGPTYYAPAPRYRTTRVVRTYEYAPEVYEEYVPARAYRTTRVVRTYETYSPAPYSWGGSSVGVSVGYTSPGYYGW